MAKKQLKKINQPKKYLQGGSNMASVAQTRQNPYYIGQVNADAAEDQFKSSQDQLAQTRVAAVQAQKESEAQQKAALDQSISSGTANLGQAILADKKAGNFGKFMLKNPNTPVAGVNAMTEVPASAVNPAYSTSWAPMSGTSAPTAATFGQQVPTTTVNPVFTSAGGSPATQMSVGQAAPTMSTAGGTPVTGASSNIASTGTTAAGASSGGLMTANMSSLGVAGIGIAANVGGQIIQKRANDNSAYTFTDKERRGNVGGSALSSAGTGFSTGAMIGSIVPGIGNVVGGLIGAGIGAGVGALKARKENKASQEEADRLQREQAAVRGSYQSAFVNSRLTGADTGFGLNSSTNMNNQFTNQYQVAKLGGVAGIQEDRRTKKVPGGKIVPIEGTDAVEFVGRTHAQGGIRIDENTEVEGGGKNGQGETMDQVAMSNNNKQDYIFSKYLKLGGKSFAQRHKEILKGSGSQQEIQQLAAMQEKVAGRNPQQVAAYGGFHKYEEGGTPCPPGYIKDPSGNCVPISDVVAEQNKTSNSSTASKVDMEAAYQDYMMGKKADELKVVQNATPSVAANATVNPGVQAPANTQPVAQTDNTVAPDGTKLPAGYVWDATLNAPVSATADAAATNASANKAGTATYNPAPGVSPQSGSTNPPIVTTTGTSTDPTVTYVNSNDPNAPAVAQTPEEIEAARLAGLPRYFMGANRKVDETTGNVTIDKGKPELMGVGAMAGSRLGTATASQEDLAKITNNSYDQAWTNKADNLYTNQKDASGGGLSSSDAIADRDKIAESNWGQKYGYKKGMSADEAKAAHGKFAEDVHSLFANKPDEMLGYFQYIVDGGDPAKGDSYLGKDAEQIRNNLKTKGFIGADGRPIPGKEKEMATYLEGQATNNAVGPIHNALGSYTAERGSDKIKLEQKKKKDEIITQEIPKKYEPCPPGTYRSGDGTCKEVGDVPQKSKISGTMLAGLGQLVPVGAALMNPYKIAPGIIGAPAVKGSLMPRMNLNQERASAIQQNVAYKNAVLGQNAGPAALVAMQSANSKTDQQMMQIAKQEQDTNRQLAAEEGKMGMQASMFNAEAQQKTQMFNKEFNQKERQYRREDLLGALDTGAARIAGIVKDDRNFKAQERLATALDETGSYDRFSILEQLNKESKRKNSPYANTTEAERRRIAAAMHKELNPEGYVGKSEYTKLQEENAKMKKEQEELEKAGKAKFGGARQYVSRLGQLSGVRATKAKI